MSLYADDLPDSFMENAYFGLLKTFGIKGELKFLSSILTENESILALTRGWVDGRSWMMAVSDSRVILIHCGLVYGLKYLEVPIIKIKSVSYKTGLFFGTIFIDTGAGTVVLDSVNKKNASEVSNILCEALTDSVQSSPSATKSSLIINQLERLAALKDKGILTEKEFLSQKEILLANSDGSRLSADPAISKVKGKVETKPESLQAEPKKTPEIRVLSDGESPIPKPPSPGGRVGLGRPSVTKSYANKERN
jgi:hypothetical protein